MGEDPGSPEPEQVAAALATWVAEHWDPDLPLVAWRRLLADAGWAAPAWPERWGGRGLPAWADELVADKLARLGAVGPPVGSAVALAAPTILAHGPDPVRDRFLRPIVTGEEVWCQLFSEPGAGSDLASLTTTATLDGDEWVVNGQKVWNTGAHHADLGMLLARTDPSVPKHRGLTYLLLPMHQPGVEVRPLRQMNDHATFNEVFLTDARVPARHVVGEVGQGWPAALTTLAHERRFGGRRPPAYAPGPGRALVEARREAEDYFATYRWYPQRAGRPDLVVEHARAAGVAGDPLVRQGVARVVSLQRVSAWTAQRARDNRDRGQPPGAEGSIGKLAMSELARSSAAVHSSIVGAGGLVQGHEAPYDGTIAEVLLSVPAQSIAGGTDEVQKNILGERMLGLPREPAADRDLPFDQTRRNTGG